jgi:polysaccharide export outer membrane protein
MNVPKKSFAIFLGLFFLIAGQIEIAVADYAIGPDDTVRITVYGYDDLKTENRVSATGRITFPLVGEVEVAGKSASEIERDLAALLIKGGFIIDPQVNVRVVNYKSQEVSVLGQVNKPGRYILDSASTLVDVIAMAGGVSNVGDEKAIVTRQNKGTITKQEFNLQKLLQSAESKELVAMQQGDIIYIPKAPMFYIYGEVQKPGGYRLEPKLTVAQALSLGGGLTVRGTERGIIIKRSLDNGENQSRDASLSDLVQKDDVVFVDERLF